MARYPKQTFLQGLHTVDQQTHGKMLNITDYQEIQIKTRMRYHLMSVKMAKIKKQEL